MDMLIHPGAMLEPKANHTMPLLNMHSYDTMDRQRMCTIKDFWGVARCLYSRGYNACVFNLFNDDMHVVLGTNWIQSEFTQIHTEKKLTAFVCTLERPTDILQMAWSSSAGIQDEYCITVFTEENKAISKDMLDRWNPHTLPMGSVVTVILFILDSNILVHDRRLIDAWKERTFGHLPLMPVIEFILRTDLHVRRQQLAYYSQVHVMTEHHTGLLENLYGINANKLPRVSVNDAHMRYLGIKALSGKVYQSDRIFLERGPSRTYRITQ
jgi:DNA-directed RNA polymerase subunit H (RpoH/RPB5)